jgi:hypothetical protein
MSNKPPYLSNAFFFRRNHKKLEKPMFFGLF